MSSNEKRLLVIEDDHAVRVGLVRGLKSAGFSVLCAADGSVGVTMALDEPFDLIILDLMLPERDGFDLLEAWRSRISTPVIVLSARTELAARLRSFSLGAVDYQAKPFFIEELIARIHARLGIKDAAPRRIALCDLLIDLDGRTVSRDGEALSFTRNEFNLLACLLERPGRAISRRFLADHALPEDGARTDRTVDSHLSRVRAKLGDAGGSIKTVWGVGYRFDPPGGEA